MVVDSTCEMHSLYVMGKLTLHVDDDLIAAAKDEAASRKTSVSRLVSSYFRALATPRARGNVRDLPPITASLLGCIEGAEVTTEDYIDYLEKKHS